MNLPRQPQEPLGENLFGILGVIGLSLFGIWMVYLGWRKYRNRPGATKSKPPKRPTDFLQ